MKRKQIISILLSITLALSVVGCGNVTNKGEESVSQRIEADVTKEEAFTTIPEEKLVTDYMKKQLAHDVSFIEDGNQFINLYFFDKQPTDSTLISRYGLEYNTQTIYNAKDLHSKYADLYDAGMTTLYTQLHIKNETGDKFVNNKLIKQIVGYLSDIWNSQKNDDYVLAEEFKEKNPNETFQKYLKENDIEIKDITYPTFVTGFNYVVGADVATVKVNIKGTQNKKEFEKTFALDFYFAPSKDIRTCVKLDDKLSDKDFEIMAVSTGTVPADQFDTFFKYDISKAKEKFGIN